MEFAVNRLRADDSYRILAGGLHRLNYLSNYIWIALGAVVGASARYFLSTLISRDFASAFPYGTLLINIIGFFLVFSTERALLDPRWRLLVAIGFCGSYTTFSSYAFESFALMEQGQWLLTGINIVASNALCLAAVLAGAALARGL
jgi:CrcB protein